MLQYPRVVPNQTRDADTHCAPAAEGPELSPSLTLAADQLEQRSETILTNPQTTMEATSFLPCDMDLNSVLTKMAEVQCIENELLRIVTVTLCFVFPPLSVI